MTYNIWHIFLINTLCMAFTTLRKPSWCIRRPSIFPFRLFIVFNKFLFFYIILGTSLLFSIQLIHSHSPPATHLQRLQLFFVSTCHCPMSISHCLTMQYSKCTPLKMFFIVKSFFSYRDHWTTTINLFDQNLYI